MGVDAIDEFFARMNSAWVRVLTGDKEAEAEFWANLSAGEHLMPALLDKEAIAAWVTEQVVEKTAGAGHPRYEESEYRTRIQKVAMNLQHPFLLFIFPDMIAGAKEDPLEILDTLVAKIPNRNWPGTST